MTATETRGLAIDFRSPSPVLDRTPNPGARSALPLSPYRHPSSGSNKFRAATRAAVSLSKSITSLGMRM